MLHSTPAQPPMEGSRARQQSIQYHPASPAKGPHERQREAMAAVSITDTRLILLK